MTEESLKGCKCRSYKDIQVGCGGKLASDILPSAVRYSIVPVYIKSSGTLGLNSFPSKYVMLTDSVVAGLDLSDLYSYS